MSKLPHLPNPAETTVSNLPDYFRSLHEILQIKAVELFLDRPLMKFDEGIQVLFENNERPSSASRTFVAGCSVLLIDEENLEFSERYFAFYSDNTVEIRKDVSPERNIEVIQDWNEGTVRIVKTVGRAIRFGSFLLNQACDKIEELLAMEEDEGFCDKEPETVVSRPSSSKPPA